MLLPIHGKPIIWWAWTMAAGFFGPDNTILACPSHDHDAFQLAIPEARVFGWWGAESDVVGRLYHCAIQERKLDRAIIHRLTPDDWPIDVTRETFTLAQLCEWHRTVTDPDLREHMGKLLPGRIELNTQADYDALKARMEPA
jgi:hypothetical protein